MQTVKSGHGKDNDDVKSLKGTLVSVGLVGAVIVIMWIAVFALYMSRV